MSALGIDEKLEHRMEELISRQAALKDGEEKIRQALQQLTLILKTDLDRSGYEDQWKRLVALLNQQVEKRLFTIRQGRRAGTV